MASCGEEFTFTWKIENFSCLPHQQGEKFESPEFIVESVMKSKWCLCMCSRGSIYHKYNNSMMLCLCNRESTPLTIFYFSFLVDTNQEKNVKKNWQKITITNSDYSNIALIPNYFEIKHSCLPQDVLTIKFCIRPDNESGEIHENTEPTIVPDPFQRRCFCITKIAVHRRSLCWPIKKIRKHFKNGRKTIISLNSALRNAPSMQLSFSISENCNEKYAQIEILATHSPYEEKRLFVKCKMEILTGDKIDRNSMEDTHLFKLELDDKWIFPSFVKTKELTNEKYLYVDDALLLQCDFSFTYPGKEYHVEAPQYAPCLLEKKKTTKVNRLCDSIRQLYTSGDLCGVTLRADGKAFPVHKLILCARSPVFSAMLQTDMKEKETSVVEITDVDAETLKRFLKYLYSDTVDEELTPEEVSNLYKAADKYQVDLLKRQCSVLLLSTLSVTSVCDVLVLADAHQDHFLMSAVNNFLHYHLNETLNSNEWSEFMDRCPKLSGIVMFEAWKSKPFF